MRGIDNMRKKSVYAMLFVAVASLLGGCGATLPELSEEDYALVAEYAAGELMKYNKLNEGRIVSDEVIAEQLAKEEQFRRNTQEYLEKVQREKEEEKKSDSEGGKTSAAGSSKMAETSDIASFIGLTPLTVTYTGVEVCDSYPQSSAEEFYFAMDATEGKDLVILKFDVSNPSDTDVDVDVLESGTGFWVSFQGESAVSILATMLPNDFATLKQVVPAGSSEEVVLVLELDEGATENIGSISMLMRNDRGTARTVLQ